MEEFIVESCDFALSAWRDASAADYIQVVLFVVLAGWLIRRFDW